MSWQITFWLWWAVKLCKWTYIDIKRDSDDNVEAITFSLNKEYIDKVSEIE
jgi:hypothetical protein